HPLTVTALTQLDYFTKRAKTEYRVTTETDISIALHDVIPALREKAIPFLNQHQDVQAWNAAVNSESNNVCGDSSTLIDRCNSVDSSNHPYRGMHAIILSYLAGNTKFEVIVRCLQEFYKESMEAIDKLNRLVDYLKQHPREAAN